MLARANGDAGGGGNGGGGGGGADFRGDENRGRRTELTMGEAFGCGAIVGAISVPVTHPIDVVKTNIMAYKGQSFLRHRPNLHLRTLGAAAERLQHRL